MRYLILGWLLIFSAGCIPYSDNPLTDPSPEGLDKEIMGTWFWQENGERGFLHIGQDEETKLLRLVMVDFHEDGKMNVTELSGHTSFLGGKKYLNLKWLRPAEEMVPGYVFYKYEVKDKKLGLAFLINSGVLDQAIKDKSLRGEIPTDKDKAATHITASQQELRQYIIQHEKELFEEMIFISRLELPENLRGAVTPEVQSAQDLP